ncbi:molecular chaperone HtpG [Clostridium sp. AF18-27]|uniref:Molecular chaperone HtpG n=1 Tax=Enterocloster lavalensis TaxID=460384 RepID=A0A1I0DWD2_9FIRM|nr:MULTISPECIES: molecular chaperone HtpG [Enterocloster]MDR3758328.1 molecular chaperone HtpG [Enterocloster sp.]PST34561.1 molecular chaperone HtpG [Enterocloster lavalensis]RHR54521.1 molecular chaperone HtpG [Clostridium sp. AF18-27]SET36949.1 molecular chaperone HtpG [Enterocloster lavalensis]
MAKKGSLSITSENIFPVIKKWLYSDHDIFYRELVSNGCDAITKLKKLELIGEYERPEDMDYKIQVSVNPNEKTIKVTDNGLGMTEDEIDKYINQIAFSGVQDFLEKYKDKANEDQIIGHFGLGFYSAFMVADKVTIDTLSYQKDAKPVHWESEGGINFEMAEGDKEQVGTTITLYLNEDSHEFCNEYRAREVLDKYCAFMPVPIFLDNETAEPQYETIEKDELTDKDTIVETVVEPAKTEEKENEDGTKETVEVEPSREKYKILKRPVALNDVSPLWNKHPNECTAEDYKAFYRKVFMDYKEPLFWIHLNMDYPFNLKGILYFPKINMEYDSLEGTIKLYNNQVFIADNIKEVIPEFLMLLKGVIDCPDLPLNVSRSALQNDGFVKKISDYITKKVADKLSGMCKTDRENYEKYWDDIAPFIKFGYIKDEKFAEKMGDYILFKNLDGKYLTFTDCLEENKEKHENTIFYVTNEKEQSQYINLFRQEGIDAVLLPHNIDSPFISHMEQKHEGVKFLRIDTDLNAAFKEEVKEDDEEFKKSSEELTELFKKALSNDKLDIKVEKMKNEGVASMITVSEETRRMQDMMKMYNMGGMDPSMFGGTGETLVLNANHPLVKYVLNNKESQNTDKICEQLYDLASLSHGPLSPERMTKFVARSNEIMLIMAGEKAE